MTKTSKAKSSKASTGKKAITKKPTAAHPSWKTIITECITVHREEARTGVSRQLLKKFATEKYKLEPTAINVAHLNHAITHGAEKGFFLLPKGPSGRVKLSPSSKSMGTSNENAKPSPKPSVKSTKVVAISTKPNLTVVKKTASTKSVKTAVAKNSAVKPKTTKARGNTAKVKA